MGHSWGTLTAGVEGKRGLWHHLSEWDAPAQLWEPQSHYGVHLLTHVRCQVLQLEEPVPELEALAGTPDRHRGHPVKYNSALEGPLEEGLQLTWAR